MPTNCWLATDVANSNIFDLRAALANAANNLVVPKQRLDQLAAEMDDPGLPPPVRTQLHAQFDQQAQVVASLTAAHDAAKAAYDAAVAADPMHQADTGLPLVLLPVRIETAYLPAASGTDLLVRVYPDDIHVDAHEPALTDAELVAGTAYWRAVWGAGANVSRLDAAWHAILGQLKPSRAAWAVQALMPSVPRPPVETPIDQPQPEPPVAAVSTRPGNFTRAALTMLLPDLWHVIGLRDGQVIFAVDGTPIPDSLDVSFGPPGTGAGSSDLPFDAGSRWLVDLTAAIGKGMAVRIPLAGPDLTVDQLFVLGVSARVAADAAASRLQSLFTAHEFTNGLGFLPPGTPTNNTSASRSAWQSAPDPPTPSDLEAARAKYVPASRQNAAVTAAALGIDGRPTLSAAPHGLDDQQTAVFRLQRQLWPALGGKALSLLQWQWDIPPGKSPIDGGWHLHDDPASTAALRDHVAGWVRSRGTLPTLRVGNQPYGLLPASSLTAWATAADDPTTALVGWLRLFHPYWLAGVANTPRVIVGGGQDPDAAIVDVLGRTPLSVDVILRPSGDPIAQVVSDKPLPLAPIPELPASTELFLSAPGPTSQRLRVPMVADAAADQKLLNLFRTLFSDSIAVLDQTMPAQDWLNKYQPIIGAATFPDAPPPDLFTGFMQDSFTDRGTTPDNDVIVGIVFGALFFEQKKDDPDFQQRVRDVLPRARAIVAQVQEACEVSPDVYDMVLREILDAFSHRFDAWVTSLAARRLEQLRTAKPTGVVIGGYGWIEDLAPRTDLTPVQTSAPGFDNVFSSPRQHFVHAPSLHHAATAAVLRAGYDSHGDSQALGVNLISRRVRTADWLAAGVRNGQTLSALLGYRFERGLHDEDLDELIERFRAEHPLPLPPDPDGGGNGAREAIAARNVVDGLDLYKKRNEVKAEFAGTPKVGALLDDLADAVDALGDLLLAESVHHLVGGNPLRAGLAADTIGRGETIPDRFDVVRTPRSGRPLTWHIGALLPASWRGIARGWKGDRPRAAVAPRVEGWAATLLGDADQWKVTCELTSSAGATSSVRRGLDTFNLSALDVVVEATGDPSQLERRIADLVAAGQPDGTKVVVSRAPAADGTLSFAELLGLAARIRTMLGTASPLGPQHVEGPDAPAVLGLDGAELDSRAAALRTSLQSAVTALSDAARALDAAVSSDPAATPAAVDKVREALVAIADHGVASAYPTPRPVDAATIAAQASSTLAVVGPLAEEKLPDLPAADSKPLFFTRWLDRVTSYVQEITGKTVPVVATFTLPATSTYADSLAAGATPVGADAPAVRAWMRRLATVRPRIAALHDALIAAEALGTTPSLTAVQLPVQAGARWIGLPYEKASAPKTRVGLVLSTPAPIDPAAAFCGLAIDTWTESLPGITAVTEPSRGHEPMEVTGMAFTVDAPDAYPPQAILLAVAPDPSRPWSLDVLLDIVRETLELAKVRAVDLGDLPRLGRVFPAIQSGTNVDDMLTKAGVTS
jgi:hypothetical protein